jgi:predicted nucleic acid-binding protein
VRSSEDGFAGQARGAQSALDSFIGRWSAQDERLPTSDIWIAAQAMESGAELLSFDRGFEEIDGLVWARPLDR